ncbi:MAG: APC family permease [Dehalococcoidia bacterium]|jgi:amino acid transporter
MPSPGSGPQYTPVADSSGRVSRYRVEFPHAGIVETEEGRFEATEFAERRSGWAGRLKDFKDSLIGTSMHSRRLAEERLSKKVALAIFSSDALSSTAYATQEILLILVLAGTATIHLSLPIALAITALLAIVVVSYSQLIRAYPAGGGAYTVALENLGAIFGLIAASALLIDYTLTAAVSIAACVEAIVSASPDVDKVRVYLAIGLIGLIALGNLRGIRESGTLFSIPTYGFVFMLAGTILFGMAKVFTGDDPNILKTGDPTKAAEHATHALTLFLVLRAFSAGCAALTGVEAISNGVSAFKPPEWKNAILTMIAMGVLLAFLFLGTTLLARHYGIVYEHGDKETVMSQVGEHVFGRNLLYYTLQGFTAGILFLAANTAYNGFPILASILARDGYLPRIFHQRGNRLVFSYGILALTSFAAALLIGFQASTTRLIPLYALGVFLCFTLAQTGMVYLWFRRKSPGWRRSAAINGFGAVVTAVVFVIIMVTKFAEGGVAVVIAIPIITALLWAIGRFYKRLQRQLYVSPEALLEMSPHGDSRIPILVPVEDVNLATVMTLGAACERSRDVTAIHVLVDPDAPSTVSARWNRQFPGIPLVVIDSPFRTVADPIARYVDDRLKRAPHEVTVMVPLLEVKHWYHRPLVNQSLKRLTRLLQNRRHVNVVQHPFSAGSMGRRRGRQALPDSFGGG